MKFRFGLIYIQFFIVAATALLIYSCHNDNKAQDNNKVSDSTSVKKKDSNTSQKDAVIDTFPLINYTKIRINSQQQLKEILARFPKPSETDVNIKPKNKPFNKLRILTTLNRKELRYIRVGDSLLIPDAIIEDLRAYSVFPPYYPGGKDLKKIILVSNKYQCYACYEYGKLIRFAASNTGKETTPTYPGRYALVWKELVRISSLDDSWIMPYAWNYHKEAGSAFHQFEMPGRPLSHSCCRQFMEDAKWLFKWGEGEKKDSLGKYIPLSGTPVIILDLFDFTRKHYGAWIDLKNNHESDIYLPDNPMIVEEALIPWCQIPKTSRGCLRNRARYIHAEDTLRAHGIIRKGVTIRESVDFNKEKEKKGKYVEKDKKVIEKRKRAIIKKLGLGV